MRVANLKTSRPFMCTKCSPAATVSALAGSREPPAGRYRCIAARAVGAELEAEEAALLDVLEHHRARAVAEEDAGRAVLSSR